MFRYISIACLSIIVSLTALAQEEGIYETETHTGQGHLNRLGLCSGLTFVPTDLTNDKKDYLAVPTYGIEYIRKIKKWFLLGFVNEFELENYVIEHENEESIERSYIYVVSVLALFKPVKNLVIFAGPGYELTSDHNFEVLKIGVSYEFELSEKWDLAPLVYMDKVSDLYT
ncbi:MAG TPA: hypothetical protein DCX54_04425, partial [Flavobacteriales bacterium]|nr:hypothetical protein [Flavobacteriales bacterium]